MSKKLRGLRMFDPSTSPEGVGTTQTRRIVFYRLGKVGSKRDGMWTAFWQPWDEDGSVENPGYGATWIDAIIDAVKKAK